jgi:hypothetical protein
MIIREDDLSFKALLLASCAGFQEGIVPPIWELISRSSVEAMTTDDIFPSLLVA